MWAAAAAARLFVPADSSLWRCGRRCWREGGRCLPSPSPPRLQQQGGKRSSPLRLRSPPAAGMCDCHGEAALRGGLAQETPLRAGRPAAGRPYEAGRSGQAGRCQHRSFPAFPSPQSYLRSERPPVGLAAFPSAGAAVVSSRRPLAAAGARLRRAAARRFDCREVAAPGPPAAAGGLFGDGCWDTAAGGERPRSPRCLLPPLQPVGPGLSCCRWNAASSAERSPRAARGSRRRDLLRGSLPAALPDPLVLKGSFAAAPTCSALPGP